MGSPSPSDLLWVIGYTPHGRWLFPIVREAVRAEWLAAQRMAHAQLGDESLAHELMEAAISQTHETLAAGHDATVDEARKVLSVHFRNGVPSMLPQLADLLVSGQLRSFGMVALESCISIRRPLIGLLLEAAMYPLRLQFHRQIPNSNRLPPWLTRRAVYVLKRSAPPYPESRSIRSRPSAVASGMGWWGLLETMPHLAPRIGSRLEYRYPYLDRDLVDYLHRIPNGQLVRPGRRRSLMRRALSGIVPNEVLERRRKGFLSRNRGVLLAEKSQSLRLRMAHSDLSSLGLVDPTVLDRYLSGPISREQEKWVPALMRVVLLDIFIRSLPSAT